MKKFLSVALCVIMMLMCFSACSSANNEMTEANITKTVDKAFDALQDFDTEDLKKYVDSPTLTIIMGYAEKHQQFADLGKAIFSNLSHEVTNIDLENKQVTVKISNKNLEEVAGAFADGLKKDYSTFQLLAKLSDDNFLDRKLSELTTDISNAPLLDGAIEITLDIEQGSKNLVLVFGDESENAVSGGALSAIKSIYGGNK